MRDLRRAGRYAARRRRKNIWRSVVTGIAAVVVFCTTYALILPAITMEAATPSCGMKEHTHTEECYQLICSQQEYFSHSHGEECYEEGQLVCTLTERICHHHDADCYSKAQPICGQEETPAHAHGEACYERRSVLICGLEETADHTHGEECYQEQQVLICGQEETQGHSHTAECYPVDFQPELICGQEDIPEHRHGGECYLCICEMEEHTHTQECYAAAGNSTIDWTDPEAALAEGYMLLCENTDETHTHTAECYAPLDLEDIDWTDPEAALAEGYTLLCVNMDEGHVHTQECYDIPLGQEEMGSNYNSESGIMLLAEGDTENLPVTSLSATGSTADNKIVYDPDTDTFSASVEIQFLFPAPADSTQKAVSAGTIYTYTYPDGIIISDALLNSDQTLLDKGNRNAGTYRFVKNSDGTYSVQVILSKTYVDSYVDAGEDFDGFVNFGYSFSGSDLEGDSFKLGETTNLVPIDAEIKYPKDSTESYDIDVSKSGSWVQDGDTLVYTVYVRTTKGTPNPISVSDIMTIPEGLTVGEPTVQIEKGQSTYYKNYQNLWTETAVGNWTDATWISKDYSAGNLNIALGKLEATETTDTGGTACIYADTYRITYTYPITDQTVESVSPENKVTVSAEDSDKGQMVTDDDKTTVDINKDMSYTVAKNGAIASEKPGYIKWTVTVNSNKQDLVGATLTDVMLGQVENATDVTISPDTGAAFDQTQGTITFSAVGDTGVNKNTYTITYYTPAEQTWDGSTVNNTATLDPDPTKEDDEKEVHASVKVNGVQFDKTGSHNAATNKLDWVITINSGNLDIAGATLEDRMFSELSETDFTIEPNSGLTFVKDSDNKITGITFEAVTDGKNTQSYTITYSTDIPTDDEGTQVTSVTNTATLSPADGETGTPITVSPTVTLEEAKLEKSGSYESWNSQIKWTVTVNGNNKNIAGAVLTDSMLDQLAPGTSISIVKNYWETPDSAEYTINTDESGNVTSITFNGIGDTGVNTNQYVLTYYTTALQEWSSKTVSNVATLNLNGKDINTPADVSVPGTGAFAKSAGQWTVDGNTLTISWTVTLTVPKGGLPIDTIIIDDVTRNEWNNTGMSQWITEDQATALINGGMSWTDADGNPVLDESGQPITVSLSASQVTFTGSAGAHTGFTITLPDALIPPEGAAKLTFTYSTTADLTTATNEQNKFYNYVYDESGEKKTSAEFVYYKPSVQKTDGNWQSGDTAVSNSGSLTWKVSAKVGMGKSKLTIEDTLPEGVTLESLHLSGWGSLNMDLTVAEDGTISGTDTTNTYSVSGTYDATTRVITLNITSQTEGSTFQNGAEFILTVNCQVTDTVIAEGSKELVNTATMKLDDVEIGSSSQKQTWTFKADSQDVVSKTGAWDNNARLLTYTLIINPEGKNLDPDSDTLELVDVLKYNKTAWATITTPSWQSEEVPVNISLNQDSVVLSECLENNQRGDIITSWSWQYSSEAENEWSTYILNKITATVPDGVPLILDYTYSVTSGAQKGYTFELDVSNTATLQTDYYDSDRLESGKTWKDQTSSGGVSTDSILKLTKVDADNNGTTLSGAEFSIYAYESQTVGDVTTTEWAHKWTDITDNTTGAITIKQATKEGDRVYQTDVLYKIVETKAPSGYELSSSPTVYYFYFSGENSGAMVVPDGFSLSDAIDLTKIGNSYLVKNTKIPTTEITVNKVWKQANGDDLTNPSQSVTIKLYQKTTPGSSSDSGSGGAATGTQVGITADQNGNDVSSALDMTEVAVGSKIRIKLELNYSIDANWNWTPTVTVTGMDVSSTTGWNLADSTANNHSTYTCEGVVTEAVNISYKHYNNDIDGIHITVLEQPTTSDPGSSGNSGISTDDATPVGTVELNNTDGWSHTFTGLPVTGLDENNQTVTYYYYVVEDPVENYETSYSTNGIASGTVEVTNQAVENPVYTLPETGGVGTTPYTVGGLLLIVLAGIPLMYSQSKRRKGAR